MEPGEDTVDGSITRVLGAESKARTAIDVARAQSRERIERAHLEARAIHARGEQRIVAIRRSVERRIAEHEGQVNAAIAALRDDQPPSSHDASRVERAVGLIAAELSGGTP